MQRTLSQAVRGQAYFFPAEMDLVPLEGRQVRHHEVKNAR